MRVKAVYILVLFILPRQKFVFNYRFVEGVLFLVIGIFGIVGNLLSIMILSAPQVTTNQVT